MRRMSGILAASLLAAGCSAAATGTAPQTTPTVPPAADRDSGGGVHRVCGSHYAKDLDAGLESRTVMAGPVALVASRVSPAVSEIEPVRFFKLPVRLAAGAEATIRVTTAGASLSYDRARFPRDGDYRLADGETTVRFTGCPRHGAVFNGAVLTNGPRTVDLKVVAGGRTHHVTLTAYTGPR